MQHSTLTRFIIIFFIILHIAQAYKLTVDLSFVSICRVYVTDCHGKTLRDAGWKDCDSGYKWHWDEAPETYCLHIYPKTNGNDNRWCQGYKDDCIIVNGDLVYWEMINCAGNKCDMN
ncbi:hypothetical protein RhiirA4_486705 [Rhizophagus irregularis]|uniref:C-type lectin domain-containing protein n=1 Tax=Rhizophagus irregularis TaxID=588596 RepID=A0A2I1HRS8_9GLOM|nr:hypothetical protein RhiirA4_486705 [Rhizophagus irregularis]